MAWAEESLQLKVPARRRLEISGNIDRSEGP